MTMVNAFDPTQVGALSDQDEKLIARRQQALGPAYRLFYEKPLHLVRGDGVWLYDKDGQAYLDCYNNVASVGHCHPKVVEAISRQLGVLNTHTRYLHEDIITYAERILATMPDELGHMMFTCTGSEANDLALRIARSFTGRQGVIVTNLAYHGLTEAVSELSPSLGDFVPRSARIRLIPAPNSLTVPAAEQGAKLASDLAAAIAAMRADGIEPAAFIVDTIFSSDGLFPDPAGFLQPAVDLIQAEGGLFIADEVQPGFARTGDAFWGFQRHGVVPDMVTMGKPMGNGFPVAAAAMRPELVAEFGAKARYFNTFGGNPVASAAGMAVLDVIRDEGLQQNALRVGKMLKDGLTSIATERDDIAQVRGAGMFLAVECVTDRDTKTPDPHLAAHVVNHMRQNGVLISATGPGANVLKIRPPLVMQEAQPNGSLTPQRPPSPPRDRTLPNKNKELTALRKDQNKDGAMHFAQLNAEPLHEQAYTVLRNALLRGQLTPGQSITVRGLGTTLGVSATPVREALQRLIAEGALELAPNRSIQVPIMTREKFTEITAIRLRLECLAAETATPFADDALCEQLTSLSQRMHSAMSDGRFSDYLSDNQNFHFLLYAASGLPYLQQLISLCWLRTGPWLNMLANEGRFHSIANEEHDLIISALRRRDAQAVSKSIARDISEAGDVLLDQLAALSRE